MCKHGKSLSLPFWCLSYWWKVIGVTAPISILFIFLLVSLFINCFFHMRPCLDALQKLKFFHNLSITSIFGPMHEVVNVGKKITNYTV
jgi:hypothetical protein